MNALRAGLIRLAWASLLGLTLSPTLAQAEWKPQRKIYYGKEGEQIYNDKCAVCHLPTGAGRGGGEEDAGGFPPLAGMGMSEWLATKEGQIYVAHAIIFGPYGEIIVGDKLYIGFMPRFKPRLNNQQMVALIRYIAEKLNKPAPGYVPITEAIVEEARQRPDNKDELTRERDSLPPR